MDDTLYPPRPGSTAAKQHRRVQSYTAMYELFWPTLNPIGYFAAHFLTYPWPETPTNMLPSHIFAHPVHTKSIILNSVPCSTLETAETAQFIENLFLDSQCLDSEVTASQVVDELLEREFRFTVWLSAVTTFRCHMYVREAAVEG